jgi:hypothetical protein
MADLSLAPTDKTTQALSADFSTLPIRDQYAQVKTPAQAKEAGLGMFEQQQKSAMDLADKEGQLQVTSAQEKQKAIEGYGQTQQNLMGEYKAQKEKMPFPEFHPTQDNANDLMGLFSVISLVGTAMGASGKNSALGALKSMTGMMKGYREGRADLYVKEKNQFDKDFKNMQVKHEEVAKELNLALQLASTDKEKALAIADVAVATAGSPILREKVRVQGLGEGIKFWNGVSSDLQTAANKLEERKLKERELSQRDTSNRISATETYIASDGKSYNINKLIAPEKQLPEGVTIVSKIGTPSGAAGGIGAIQNRYNIGMTGAVNALGIEISNLASASIFARPPVLDNVLTNPANGVTSAVISSAGRGLTPADERTFQQLAAGASRAETIVMTQGRPGAATGEMFAEIGKQQPKSGDSLISAYLWLAQLKQTVNLAEKDLAMAGGNPIMMEQVGNVKKQVNELIPYDVQDVTRIIRGGGKPLLDAKVTALLKTASNNSNFERNIMSYGSTPRFKNEAEAQAAFNNKKIEKGQQIIIGNVVGVWE